MSRPLWFKHDPEHTATGYRWLDLLTAPYWYVADYLTRRRFWKFMAVNETWREARDRTRAYYREHPELLEHRPE
jgi:hypothetical protein